MSRLTRYDLSPIAIEISISSLKQRRPIKEYESLERNLNKSTIHAYTVVRKIKPKFCIVRGFVGIFDRRPNEKYRHLRNIQAKRINLYPCLRDKEEFGRNLYYPSFTLTFSHWNFPRLFLLRPIWSRVINTKQRNVIFSRNKIVRTRRGMYVF